jgi:alpha-galactosidase
MRKSHRRVKDAFTSHAPANCHRGRVAGRSVCLVLAALGCLPGIGCRGGKEARNAPALPPKSAIGVKVGPEGLTLLTPSTKFVLTASGVLTGSLEKASASLSLDADSSEPAQIVSIAHKEYSGVQLDIAHAEAHEPSGKLGSDGKQITVKGKIAGAGLDETVTLEVYDSFPQLALLSASLRNASDHDIALDSIMLQRHAFSSPAGSRKSSQTLWAFSGASLKWGKDEIFPISTDYSQENPFGAPVPVKDDLGQVGGGIPVVAFWSQDVGEAIGHVETLPFVLSIPVQTTSGGRVSAAVRIPANTMLKPGEEFSTPRTFLAVYAGDFYEPLSLWSNVIEKEGLSRPANNDENYAVSWCGWGYEFGVTPKQMLDTIPKLKELGIRWATLDDGWFNNYGDWQPRRPTFEGDAMREMVSQFHRQGMKLQLWWLPLAVEDGRDGYGGRKFVVSEVVREHPDWLILDEYGKPARMARNLAALCPALPEVQAYYKQLTERFIRDWDFDGHKLDNIYTTPPCFNPKHHHKSPYDSVYAMGEVYKTIFETTRALKPDSVTQSCPCGTPPSVAWLRYMDQAVTADPVGSAQVRRRIKMYKALLGPRAAVYGDHVELTRITNLPDNEQDVGRDFASTLGTGGVLGTKFTWPEYGPKFKNVYLNSNKDAHWKEWIGLYNQKMLSKGNFLNLYVYGFDLPEAYAIEKDGSIYYAYYAPDAPKTTGKSAPVWSGELELRGLARKRYRVEDYVHHKNLGTVTGPVAKLRADFSDSLLLEATPSP